MGPSGLLVPCQEQLINRLNLAAGTFVFPAESQLWHQFDNLIATLNVTDPDAAGTDTLDVSIETLDPMNIAITLMTFTQVLGNSVTSAILQQVRVANKTSSVSWYERMQARCVGVGGTAAFDFKLVLQGS